MISTEQHWRLVEQSLRNARAMHFDGCHKIYLSMDDGQVEEMRGYGYNVASPDLEVLRDWWEQSCGLRFVTAVHTNAADPNAGFITLIDQGEDE